MAVVVVTRFAVRSGGRYLVPFLRGSAAAAGQARKSPGFLSGRLRVEPGDGVFWTLTVWQTGRDMVAYRDSGVHAVLIPHLSEWASEAVFGVWNSSTGELPDWATASRKVAEHPNFATVAVPSDAHRARRFDPARGFGLDLPLPPRRRERLGKSRRSRLL